MFENVIKQWKTGVITDFKATIKKETEKEIDKKIPMILGLVTLSVALYNGLNSAKPEKKTCATVVNNTYYYINTQIVERKGVVR